MQTVKRPKTNHVAAALELRASGLEPVEAYPGRTSLPFTVRCVKENCPGRAAPFPTYLSSVRSLAMKGEVGCKHCRKQNRANKRREEMIRFGRMLPMVPISNVKDSVRSWCLRCWKVCDPGPRLDNIKNGGQGGCEHCGGKRRLPDDVARMRARDWGYVPDPNIPYTNDATKWPGRCIAKGHYCAPVLNSHQRSGPCETCAEHGFKPDRPALLYLVVKPELVAAKIGICEDSPKNTRLYEHGRNGWTKIEAVPFDHGSHARAVEDSVIRSWRARGFRPVLDKGFGYDGYSETVSLRDLSISQIWTDMGSVAEIVLSTVSGHRAARA